MPSDRLRSAARPSTSVEKPEPSSSMRRGRSVRTNACAISASTARSRGYVAGSRAAGTELCQARRELALGERGVRGAVELDRRERALALEQLLRQGRRSGTGLW